MRDIERDFERVFELHYPRVFRFALGLCQNAAQAEELAQQTFFKALQSIGGFRGECRLEVWLCQIAKHEFYADQRHRRRFAAPPAGTTETTEVTEGSHGPEPAVTLERREDVWRVHRALHTLDEPYKEVFSLRVFGELPFQGIAELFGKTESWARVTYYRAKLKIQECIEE